MVRFGNWIVATTYTHIIYIYTCSAIEKDGLQMSTGWSIAFSYFFVFPYKTKNGEDRPLYTYMYSMLPCHHRSFFPIRVYNHRLDCIRTKTCRGARRTWSTYPMMRLSALYTGRSVSLRSPRTGQRRTNGWKVHVYFAKRARLTNRTNPPSHKSTPSSAISVHSNRHLFSHPSQTNSSLSLYIHIPTYYYYIIFL